MKVKETVSSEKFSEDNDYRSFYEVEINGKRTFSFTDGEPEDANLGRDFSDVFGIVGAMKMAYDAGKAGHELEIEYISSDDWV